MKFSFLALPLLAILTISAASAEAPELRVGYTMSATGSAAALGVPQKNSTELLPTEIGGIKAKYFVLDDGSDGTRAVANARKLITEDRIDVLVGSTIAPTTFPLVDLAAEVHIPLIATHPSVRLVEPLDDKRRWVFKVVPNDSLMADAIAANMAKDGIKTVAFIGFNDAFGDSWYAEIEKALGQWGIKLLARESFSRTDTSVTGQILKIIAASPNAVMVGASGTPAALPQKTFKERGFTGPIYHTNGVATKEFIRVAGKDAEGVVLPVGPITVADQLPDSHPIKALALDYIKRYEERFNIPYAAFGAHITDAARLLGKAVPAALKTAQPGTPEFRVALRDALETVQDAVMINGILTLSPINHSGYDERARMMVQIKDGNFKLLP